MPQPGPEKRGPWYLPHRSYWAGDKECKEPVINITGCGAARLLVVWLMFNDRVQPSLHTLAINRGCMRPLRISHSMYCIVPTTCGLTIGSMHSLSPTSYRRCVCVCVCVSGGGGLPAGAELPRHRAEAGQTLVSEAMHSSKRSKCMPTPDVTTLKSCMGFPIRVPIQIVRQNVM